MYRKSLYSCPCFLRGVKCVLGIKLSLIYKDSIFEIIMML